MAHLGELENVVEDEVQKAVVSGNVYVAGVFWNRRNQWNSYVKVVNRSLGKNVKIQLLAGNPTTLRGIQQLKRGDWIQVQGYSAQGLPQEDGVLKVKVSW
ncbi:uncharacterized protein PGTG_12090 [Puccinia graminis f. sp. tritici CRL 75-36-700-3]|uniref:OB domain-containing protein n=1 Tax=Puccinia graminis f. sp. tritici (strain CRL 75-36-700-3 / race SCCL) TaxID=418459 RepID=E3JTV0_PUCGT|nr:uncharacterized protein PGTG_00778 [Puccinia graminis f. sp. tritici CRL 75-36-700-3]XP_003330553.2 uncharacterized protein PGTG_12090 [Puccinia graminis f. sp. tritici CRL 75-36-700-3]EFP75447.2 hypothetical protein PGTG_00778 [Puccinia graminis f. sp. tritici CRL 75-36-700-3]EFP86134.2 hypothetical protein PGTG_12090 [Puccinia graminis f. sp. tritici CRL 75-36-700-3]